MSTYTVDAEIDQNSLDQFQRWLMFKFERVRQPVQEAMAEKFFEITRLNFGQFGVDRPVEWAPLEEKYAKKVGRDYATLSITGKLEGAIQMESDPDKSRVFISKDDVPYALAHQYGYAPRGLPARPYFPIDAHGNLTPFTYGEVMAAARDAVERFIGSGVGGGIL